MENVSKKMAFGGILLALEAIFFMLINFVLMNTIFFMVLASFISSIIIIEFGEKTGTIFTFASILLSFMIIGNKVQWFIYAISFALYGLVKSLIERGRSRGTEYCIKLVFANIVFVIMYFVLKSFLTEVQYMFVLFIGLNATFLIYDLFYSQFIRMYENKLRKNISKYLE